MNRNELAALICNRLAPLKDTLHASYVNSDPIRHFIVDDLLPVSVAEQIRRAFPDGSSMKLKKSLRELKYIAAQMNKYDRLLEEAIYAFQHPEVLSIVEQITGLKALEPDEQLYAGGISMMSHGHYLNPHIDNSHDKGRDRYRLLNLLYYVSPGWNLDNGGNLELWPNGPEDKQITVESRFNRLVVMATHQTSWHSVSKVSSSQLRCCVSNYYFSKTSPEEQEYFHVTSFRGRPEQPVRDLVLRLDIAVRSGLRKLFPKGVVENKHFYDKK